MVVASDGDKKGEIFIYSGWRTGGSALAYAFKQIPAVCVFYDPLNPALKNEETAVSSNSSSWNSNHPENYVYFDSYFDLFKNGEIPGFPNLEKFKFRNLEIGARNEIVEYFEILSNHARTQNKVPVFKMEQMEGLSGLLRKAFPGSFHIGVVRDPESQLLSWYEQLTLGGSGFFDAAKRLIDGDPEFFNTFINSYKPYWRNVFYQYYYGLESIRHELDLIINISESSPSENLNRLETLENGKFYHLDILRQALLNLNQLPKIGVESKFKRAIENQLKIIDQRDELVAQRDELVAQRDELVAQRDELVAQRDSVLNSTTWRSTRPIRMAIQWVRQLRGL